VASLVITAAAAGCTGSLPGEPRVCTAVAVQALDVTVLDATSRQRICDATVVAVDGAFLATLQSFGTEADCVHAGPTERSGVYEVRVSKPGYAPATVSNVRVAEDECHVIPVQLTISLSR
jgi:hypothetical protein